MTGQEKTAEESLKFFDISIKHPKAFLLFDQINKKYGAEIYQLDDNCFKTAVFFEVEKIKRYLATTKKIEELEGKLYVFQKSFLKFFLEKSPNKKCQLMNSYLQALLAQIYEFRVSIKAMADDIMDSPDICDTHKAIFLIWYDKNSFEIKEELDEITDDVL